MSSSAAAPPATLVHLLGPDELFDGWAASRANEGKTKERISQASAQLYRAYWGRWVRWLAGRAFTDAAGAERPCTIWDATARDVDEFLLTGLGGRIQTRTDGTDAPVSPVTQIRYGSLLERLYEFAKNDSRKGGRSLPVNPAKERTVGLARPKAPGMPRQDPAGEALILNREQWKLVRAALPVSGSTELVDVRDRALLLLLMDVHLTAGELQDLQLGDIVDTLERPLNMKLVIEGNRRAQSRTLLLAADTNEALHNWLQLREKIFAGATVVPRRGRVVKPPPESHQVFVTRRGKPLSGEQLLKVVGAVIQRSFEGKFLRPYHRGPQVLRNTRIAFRLEDGDDPATVAADAGFKDQRSFRGLRGRLSEQALKAIEPKRHKTRRHPRLGES